MDYIGRFENMRETFDLLARRFALHVDAIPHEKRIDGKPVYTDFYDDEAICLVSNVYADDIRAFGYDFPT